MSHSKHIIRKSVIVGLSFAVGVVSTVFAAATYDANIQNRANTLFTTIKSNASKMDPSTVPSYYTLVRTNIASLIQVLTTLDSSIAGELGLLSLPGLDDGSLLGQITGTGNSGTGNSQNIGSTTTNTGSIFVKCDILPENAFWHSSISPDVRKMEYQNHKDSIVTYGVFSLSTGDDFMSIDAKCRDKSDASLECRKNALAALIGKQKSIGKQVFAGKNTTPLYQKYSANPEINQLFKNSIYINPNIYGDDNKIQREIVGMARTIVASEDRLYLATSNPEMNKKNLESYDLKKRNFHPSQVTTLTNQYNSCLFDCVPGSIWNGKTCQISEPQRADTTYPGCDKSDIKIGSQTWASCNVGANNSTEYKLSLYPSPFKGAGSILSVDQKKGIILYRDDGYSNKESRSLDLFKKTESYYKDTSSIFGNLFQYGYSKPLGITIGKLKCGDDEYYKNYDENNPRYMCEASFINPIANSGFDVIDSRSIEWGLVDPKKSFSTMSFSEKESAQGVCKDGYHIPTKLEWEGLLDNFLGSAEGISATLRLPIGMNYLSSSAGVPKKIWVYSNPETPCDDELVASGNCHIKSFDNAVMFTGKEISETTAFGLVRCIKD